MPDDHQRVDPPGGDPAVPGTRTDERWADLCSVDALADDGGRYVVHNGHGYAVFRVGPDQVRVLDDACPHAGASLAGGHVSGDCVVCPWHAWPFHMDSGQCPDNPAVKVNTYQVRVVAGRVWVKLR